ncbi:MAG: TIGR02147 family protein [Bacteriovoracaceae bacterium]
MDIFAFNDYKQFLKEQLQLRGHGSRLELASALNCQSAYITRVLNHDAHLSLEQAVEASQFFHLGAEEEDFFLLLIQYSKAGTKKLQDLTKKKIKAIRERRALLSNRVTIKEELDESNQAKYYSKWYYAAIHIAVTVPELTTKESISHYLNLPMNLTLEALEFLVRTGLIHQEEGKYSPGKSRIFLKGDSPFVTQHHENWRLKAMNNMQTGNKNNIHFSSVYSLSHKDFEIIKEKLLQNIQEVRGVVPPSKEEELCVLNLDFFSLKG